MQELLLQELLLVEDWGGRGDSRTPHLFERCLDLILRESLLGEEVPLGLLRAVSHLVILQESHCSGDLQQTVSRRTLSLLATYYVLSDSLPALHDLINL